MDRASQNREGLMRESRSAFREAGLREGMTAVLSRHTAARHHDIKVVRGHQIRDFESSGRQDREALGEENFRME